MLDLLPALVLFAVAASFTPGPNTLMLAASGANHGFRRSLPHMLGITLGFPALLLSVALGLGVVFRGWPLLHEILKIGGAGYLLYLAWRIARAGSPDSGDAGGRPLRFFEAVAFQWVNIKAWMMAVTTISAFTTVGGFLYYGELAVIEPRVEYVPQQSIRPDFVKPWLSDEADVDAYLEELKKAMMEAISEGKRVQL